MKIMKIILVILLSVLVVVAVIAPIGPLPGLFIGGTETSVPEKWPDTTAIHEIKLEIPGTLPRVVIIWVIQVDGDLHVVGSKQSGWVSMLGQGGPVRLRMDDKTYAMNASPVTENWQAVLIAYQGKYRADYPEIIDGFPPIEEAKATAAIFRLTAR